MNQNKRKTNPGRIGSKTKKAGEPAFFVWLERIRLEASAIVAVVSTAAAKDEQDDPDAVASVATSAVSVKETAVSATAAKQ